MHQHFFECACGIPMSEVDETYISKPDESRLRDAIQQLSGAIQQGSEVSQQLSIAIQQLRHMQTVIRGT